MPEGVTLCNARGVHDASTAELAVTLVLASLRGVPAFVRDQDRGVWDQQPAPALADKRVMILGYGSIGAAIEARLMPFEVEVVRVARSARDGVHAFDELPDLLPDVDVVVLVVPLTEETRGLVDADFLARLKDDALVVNVARGAVDRHRRPAGRADGERIAAALDVTDPEPLPEDHPLWRAPRLLRLPARRRGDQRDVAPGHEARARAARALRRRRAARQPDDRRLLSRPASGPDVGPGRARVIGPDPTDQGRSPWGPVCCW